MFLVLVVEVETKKKFSRRSVPQRLAGFVLSGAELRHAVLPVVLRVLEEQKSAAPLIVEHRECWFLSTHIFNERWNTCFRAVLHARLRSTPHQTTSRWSRLASRHFEIVAQCITKMFIFLYGGNSLLTLFFFSFPLSEIIVLKSTQYVF